MSEQITYKFTEHLIEQQYAAEQAMLAELEAGNYTLDNPLVKYNAYLVNPLSAVVLFKTEEETAIKVTVLGKTPQANIYHTFPRAKTHVLPIVGLYSDYTNKVEISAYQGRTTVVEIQTPDVYNGVKPVYSMETTPEYLQDNIILVSPAGEDLASGFDYAGDARWHMNVACVFDVKRLKNGNLIMGSHRLIKMPYYMSGLYEISPCGKIYKEYRLPGGYHHDEFEMEDGNLLVLTDDFQGDTVEDMCVLIDRNTGEILKTWDYKKFLQPGLGKSGSWSDEDWFHNNAVWYDKNTNSLTFSGRHMDSMVNIDYDSGELNWIISDPTGWPQEWVDKYFFKPVGDDFEWQYEQHACVITPDGDVMCFDNHHYGSKNRDEYLSAKDSYSRGVRYKINVKERTIEQVWQYGKERGAEFFSPYICNVEYYNEGHYMIHSGGIAYMNGEPSELLGAFAKQQGGDLRTITVEICNGKKELELQVPGNYYRAEKLKLYSDGINLELGKGQILGEMGVTPTFDTDVPAEVTGQLLPESCNASVNEEFDRFTFKSRFEKGQLVMLLLEGENETRRYFISTTAVPHLAMCCGTFLDSDERNTRTMVNKAGLSGTYDVRVIIDDKKYETGIRITA
ncbi:aryl-sulfate sulfotransferase [Diplocloster agilis]|uniref:aryl-sulfate sulfotransferase n=1 Tax=Diplocloster agilis TaxID=2850323 RepID=UPI0008204DEE|nr:aryl-sulfate sulfotransferase [Suonthocola fibrivorans]MCU6735865.1 aryl-sulfate sulfotransferase [Suonthocola fibrivorans]SCJ83344.1 Arylsulfotransferase (ASST) [uncultured Clostridium sp.]